MRKLTLWVLVCCHQQDYSPGLIAYFLKTPLACLWTISATLSMTIRYSVIGSTTSHETVASYNSAKLLLNGGGAYSPLQQLFGNISLNKDVRRRQWCSTGAGSLVKTLSWFECPGVWVAQAPQDATIVLLALTGAAGIICSEWNDLRVKAFSCCTSGSLIFSFFLLLHLVCVF